MQRRLASLLVCLFTAWVALLLASPPVDSLVEGDLESELAKDFETDAEGEPGVPVHSGVSTSFELHGHDCGLPLGTTGRMTARPSTGLDPSTEKDRPPERG